jgi:hypothetical protein
MDGFTGGLVANFGADRAESDGSVLCSARLRHDTAHRTMCVAAKRKQASAATRARIVANHVILSAASFV